MQERLLGQNSVGKVIGKLMAEAGFEGFVFWPFPSSYWGFTSLSGWSTKIVSKECTGHSSDAVDKYQITSDSQRETISNILQSKPEVVDSSHSDSLQKVAGTKTESNIKVTSPKVESDQNDVKPCFV